MKSKTVLFLAILSLPAWAPAAAYLDPATGSVVLQMLIAGFLGAIFALKLFWRRIVRFISGLLNRAPQSGRDEA